jgi:nicotinamidase-related amidase
MPSPNCDLDRSVLVVVDLQPAFLAGIHEAERVISRAKFLLEAARLLGVPVLASEQVPERMGGTDERLRPLLGEEPPFAKTAFSCGACVPLLQGEAATRELAVLVGIETHICVSQTAHDLLRTGKQVFVCADAVSARSPDRHAIGLERIRAAGAVVAHTESVVYEWMGGADHPRFRDVLRLVKESAQEELSV